MWNIKPCMGIEGLYIRTKGNTTIITGKAMYQLTIEEEKDGYTVVYRPKMDREDVFMVSGATTLGELVRYLEGKYEALHNDS